MNYTRRNRMSAICPQEESEGDVRPSLLASNGVIKTEEASVMFLSWEISCRGLKDLKSKAHSKTHTSCSENSHTGSITFAGILITSDMGIISQLTQHSIKTP